MMTDDRVEPFKAKLDAAYVWPALYMFKFIVPHAQVETVKVLFPNHVSSERQSENGKYMSITFNMMMPSSEAVISIYHKVKHVEGLIAL
jgi:uncharacterized protein